MRSICQAVSTASRCPVTFTDLFDTNLYTVVLSGCNTCLGGLHVLWLVDAAGSGDILTVCFGQQQHVGTFPCHNTP